MLALDSEDSGERRTVTTSLNCIRLRHATSTNPREVTDVDAFADELDASVTRVMDMLAPARSRTMRVGKRSTKWLSTSAVASKQARR